MPVLLFGKLFGGIKAIGRGFKAAGKGSLWVLKRPETRLALSLLPGPALVSEIVSVVVAVEATKGNKMKKALKEGIPIFEKYNITKNSERRLAIELAVAIMEAQLR